MVNLYVLFRYAGLWLATIRLAYEKPILFAFSQKTGQINGNRNCWEISTKVTKCKVRKATKQTNDSFNIVLK